MEYQEFQKMMKKLRPRRKSRHIESRIQIACVNWFRAKYPRYLCFSVPNGGSRNAIEAANLKREGALAGVADLIVIGKKRLLFVEMKTAKGKQSINQELFECTVKSLGFQYVICHSLDEFIRVIEEWIV